MQPHKLIDADGAVLLMYSKLDESISGIFEDVKALPLVTRPVVMVYGKECHQQRNVGFFSDTSSGYRYSGQIARSQPMTPMLNRVTQLVNETLGTDFNGVLVNHYPDGDSYIGAHSDDERGLSKTNKYVASISFGATRVFRVRHKSSKKIALDVPMPAGSMIVMGGRFQELYTHEVPKKKGLLDRWSLTFREHTD